MARKPTVELAQQWFAHAERGNVDAMGQLLADDAQFYASYLRSRRFSGRSDIERFLAEVGFEATGYSYTPVEDDYVVVSISLRRHLPGGGLADSTLAMVVKTDGEEIVCLDAFPSADAALASLNAN